VTVVRVALLAPSPTGPVAELGLALAGAGHGGAILSAGDGPEVPGFQAVRLRRLPAAPLRLRKLGDDLGVLPAALLALARGRFDAAHAFTPELACAAGIWGRRTGRPVVFTPPRPPRRETLAARRLRLAAWSRAVGTDVVAAPSGDVQAALQRWLAVSAPVVAPGDAAGHVRLYRGEYPPSGG
jgi:hypothetical protein